MLRIFFITFFLLISVNNDEAISWQENHKLSWNDFKGNPNQSIDAVAITASGITFSYSIKYTNDKVTGFNCSVEAHFYPEKSWYKPDQADAHILGHEQLHFDITELYARKFRKAISELKASNNIKKELEALHEDINVLLAKAQNSYDNKTNYSIEKEQQESWRKHIQIELKKVSKFKK